MVRPEGIGQRADKTGGYSTEFCLLSSVFIFPILQYSITPSLQFLEVL